MAEPGGQRCRPRPLQRVGCSTFAGASAGLPDVSEDSRSEEQL